MNYKKVNQKENVWEKEIEKTSNGTKGKEKDGI